MTESTPGADTGPPTEPGTGSGGRPDTGSGGRPGTGSGGRPGTGSGGRPGTGSGGRPGSGPDTGPVDGNGPGSVATTGADPTSGLRVEPVAGSVGGTVPGPGHVARPLTLGGGLAVVAAALAVLLYANAAGQVIALAIGLAGTAGLVLGIEARTRGHRLLGIVLGTLGVVGVGAGLAWGVIGTQDVQHRLEILPGIVGLAVLAVAVRGTGRGTGRTRGRTRGRRTGRGYERLLVSVGTGLILLGVFVSGMVEGAPVWAMLAATAATIVAWDTGEQAINLGQQIGRQSRTRRAELVHLGGSAAVGVLGVGVAIGFVTVGVSGLPLVGLTTLLAAVVLLAAGLYL